MAWLRGRLCPRSSSQTNAGQDAAADHGQCPGLNKVAQQPRKEQSVLPADRLSSVPKGPGMLPPRGMGGRPRAAGRVSGHSLELCRCMPYLAAHSTVSREGHLT